MNKVALLFEPIFFSFYIFITLRENSSSLYRVYDVGTVCVRVCVLINDSQQDGQYIIQRSMKETVVQRNMQELCLSAPPLTLLCRFTRPQMCVPAMSNPLMKHL